MSRSATADSDAAAEQLAETEEIVQSKAVYDESYTVVQLRAIAKSQNVSGYSTMTKAELLEVLNNGD